MINFRYHLISIIAIFLALGIGVVMGSTVIDRAIVDGLKNRIDTAEKNSIERKVENEQLKNTLQGITSQDTVLAAHTVKGSLANQTLFVFTVGDVPDNVKVETRELLAVAGARLGSEVNFKQDFVQSDKQKIVKDLRSIPSVKSLIGDEKNLDNEVSKTLAEALSIRAGGPNDFAIPVDEVLAVFDKYKAFSEQEQAGSFDPIQQVSYVVLVNRSNLSNKATNEFVTHLNSKFPTSIGLVGSEKDLPTRSNAIKGFGDQIKFFSLVDNAEAPSGRSTLLLAHAGTITGVNKVYGVSDEVSSPAPELTSS